MTTGAAVVQEARGFLGVPFAHQGRTRAGIDCVGLIIVVAHRLGISDFDTADYGEQPNPERMGALLRENLDEITVDYLRPGDIVWLRVEIPQHVAIITETEPRLMMIHALRRRGRRVSRVVEHGLDQTWSDRIKGCFRYRGIA